EARVQLASRILQDPAGDTDAVRVGETFQACSHVDAIPIDVATVDDDITNIDADPELNALLRRRVGIACDHGVLNVDGTAQRIHHTCKLHKYAIAGGLHDSAAVLPDLRIEKLAPMRIQTAKSILLICAHQPAVPGDIGGHDSGKAALGAFFGHLETAALR